MPWVSAPFEKKDPKTAGKFAKSFLKDMRPRFKKVLEQGPGWFVYESDKNGEMFKGRLAVKSKGNVVYILNFTATPGTYDKNIGNFEKWHREFQMG